MSPPLSLMGERFGLCRESGGWCIKQSQLATEKDNCLLADSARALSQDKLFQKIIGGGGGAHWAERQRHTGQDRGHRKELGPQNLLATGFFRQEVGVEVYSLLYSTTRLCLLLKPNKN